METKASRWEVVERQRWSCRRRRHRHRHARGASKMFDARVPTAPANETTAAVAGTCCCACSAAIESTYGGLNDTRPRHFFGAFFFFGSEAETRESAFFSPGQQNECSLSLFSSSFSNAEENTRRHTFVASSCFEDVEISTSSHSLSVARERQGSEKQKERRRGKSKTSQLRREQKQKLGVRILVFARSVLAFRPR